MRNDHTQQNKACFRLVVVTKLMESSNRWGFTVRHGGQLVTILGECTTPVQVMDRTTAECVLAAQMLRDSQSAHTANFKLRIRTTCEDGAASNEKAEHYGQMLKRPGKPRPP